jgi:peptide/nickel transport system substrate-binding protein
MLHKIRLTLRRTLRRRSRQFLSSTENSGDTFEKYFIQRMNRIGLVWRFVTAWLLLVVLLIGCLVVQLQALSGYYQSRRPVAGGVYNEGVLGSFTNANPIYATNDVDKTVSRLVFAGLFKYDEQNRLVGDLAKDWSVDAAGKVYTVHLRPHLTWQDGQPLTAADVAFTYKIIQNPDAESPLRGSWQNIQIAATNPTTVTFTLPNPLASFMYGVTTGIIPQHLLEDVPMVGMRSAAFNTRAPIGSGPFAWRNIEVSGVAANKARQSIGLSPFAGYWAGSPKLKSFVVHGFVNEDDMIDAYNKRELTAMSGLDSVPSAIDAAHSTVSNFTLTAETMVFFNTASGVLTDAKIRQALTLAADPATVTMALGTNPKPVREPLLSGQTGYDPQFAQKTGNTAAAAQALDAAGWLVGPGGVRVKDGKKLQFTLSIADTPEYNKVADILRQQWAKVGVKTNIEQNDTSSFRSLFSSFNPDGTHTYDALLYGITIGPDPDVFVYWDSTQADVRSANRLNLSDYKSPIVDDALEAGRTRTDVQLRTIKYQAFLKQWQADVPALGLYQPKYLYISHSPVYGLKEHPLNEAADRLYSAPDWMIRTARVTNQQ